MRKIFCLLAIFGFAITLGACKKEQTTTNDGEEIDFSDLIKPKQEIRVWMDDEAGEYMSELIKEFNKVYPNIIVKHQHMGAVDAREKLKTFGPSGNGADVFQFAHDHLSPAIREDLVYPLSDTLKTELEKRLHPTAMQIAKVCYNETSKSFACDATTKERLFAVPNSIESIALMYNKALVTTPIATFEELITEAQAFMAKPANTGKFYLGTSSHWADSYYMQFAYSAFGYRPFGPNGNDSTAVGFSKAQEALAWLKNTLKPIVTGTANHDSQNAGAKFESGELPYIIAGPWNIEAYKSKGIDVGVTNIPTIGGKPAQTFAGSIQTAVYMYSKNPEAATKFVEFLSTDVAMKLLYEKKNKLPALKTELLPENVKQDQLLMGISKQLETSIPMPTIPSIQSYWGPGETMIKTVWNEANANIAAEVAKAEESYRTNEGLSSN